MKLNHLVNQGVKEIILIAQDLTNYGEDIYTERTQLHDLVNELSKIEGIRVDKTSYTVIQKKYTDELIEEIAKNAKVVKYLDLPIQHISNNILKIMGRKTNKETIIDKIDIIKRKSSWNNFKNIINCWVPW